MIPSNPKVVIHCIIVLVSFFIFNFLYRFIFSSLVSLTEKYIFTLSTFVIFLTFNIFIIKKGVQRMTLLKSNLSTSQIRQNGIYYGSLLGIIFCSFSWIILGTLLEFTEKELLFPIFSFSIFVILLPTCFIYILSLDIPNVYGKKIIITKFNGNIILLMTAQICLFILGWVTMIIAFIAAIKIINKNNADILIFSFLSVSSLVLIFVGSYLVVVTLSVILENVSINSQNDEFHLSLK